MYPDLRGLIVLAEIGLATIFVGVPLAIIAVIVFAVRHVSFHW